jgi:hypothetical protein
MTTAFDEIRRLYFSATKASILRDFDRAIDLLKTLPSDEERQRATVYMEGLAQMRAQWVTRPGARPGKKPGKPVRKPPVR